MFEGEEFTRALALRAPHYDVQLSDAQRERLRAYYLQVQTWNKRLHLVAPCSAWEFATRHVLESLALLPHLANGLRVADIGSGAGLPIVPCLIARSDIRATLYEASPKKAVFLREVLRSIDEGGAHEVFAERFEKTAPPQIGAVTCRALDRFSEMLPALIAWSTVGGASKLLLFGGNALQAAIEQQALAYKAVQLPDSEQRFLFVANPAK